MATDLHVRVYPNPYRGYEARFYWNGQLNRYSFELRTELAIRLVDDGVEQAVIDAVMDELDHLEWSEPEYPLGVSYVPTAEAVCDSPRCDPVYANVRPAIVEPSPLWDYAAASLYIGALVAPWVAALIVGRWWWGR